MIRDKGKAPVWISGIFPYELPVRELLISIVTMVYHQCTICCCVYTEINAILIKVLIRIETILSMLLQAFDITSCCKNMQLILVYNIHATHFQWHILFCMAPLYLKPSC